MDKQQVGEVAAKIRAYRPPEPYKGQGVRYANETIILKEARRSKDLPWTRKQPTKTTRLRHGLRTRLKIRELGVCRLCVHRTPRHIYAQLINRPRPVIGLWRPHPPWSRRCARC